MIMKKLVAILLLSAVGVCEAKKRSAIVAKIAIVNEERIANPYNPDLSEVFEYKDLMKQLKKEMGERNAMLQKKQIAFEKLRKEAEAAKDPKKLDADLRAKLQKLGNELQIDS